MAFEGYFARRKREENERQQAEQQRMQDEQQKRLRALNPGMYGTFNQPKENPYLVGNPNLQAQQFGNPFGMQEDYMQATSHLIPGADDDYRRSTTGVDRFFTNLLNDPTWNYNPGSKIFTPTNFVVEQYTKRRVGEHKLQKKYGLSDSDMGIIRWQTQNFDKWRKQGFRMNIDDMNGAMESYTLDNQAYQNLMSNQMYFDTHSSTSPYATQTTSYMWNLAKLGSGDLNTWFDSMSEIQKYQLALHGFTSADDVKIALNSMELNDALQNNDLEKAEGIFKRGAKTGVGAAVATKIAAMLIAIPEPITSATGLAMIAGGGLLAGMGLEKAEQEEIAFLEDLSIAEKSFRNAMFNVLIGQVAGSIDFAANLASWPTTTLYNTVTGKDTSIEDNWINKGLGAISNTVEGINRTMQSDIKDMEYNKMQEVLYQGIPQVMGAILGYSGWGKAFQGMGLGGTASSKLASYAKDKGNFVSGILTASKGEVIMRTMRSFNEAQDVYDNAKAQGVDDNTAMQGALGSMAANWALLSVTGALPGKGVKATTSELAKVNKGLNLAKGLSMDAVYEVGEEIGQLLINDFSNIYTGAKEDFSGWATYIESAFYGAIGGAIGGGLEYMDYKKAAFQTLDSMKVKHSLHANTIDKKFNEFKETGMTNFQATDETLAWLAENRIDNTVGESIWREMALIHGRNMMEGVTAFENYWNRKLEEATKELGSKATDEEIEAKTWKIVQDEYSQETEYAKAKVQGKDDRANTIRKSNMENHYNTIEALDNGYNPSNESQKTQNNVIKDIKSETNPDGTFEMQRAVELSNVKSTLSDDRNTFVDTYRAMKDNNITINDLTEWQQQTDNSYLDGDHLKRAREHVATMKKQVNDMIDGTPKAAKKWNNENKLKAEDYDYMALTNVITKDELVDVLNTLDMKSTKFDEVNRAIEYTDAIEGMYDDFRVTKDWDKAKNNYDKWQDRINKDWESYSDYENYLHRISKHINQNALNYMNKFEELYAKQEIDGREQRIKEQIEKLVDTETKIKKADESLKKAKDELKVAKEKEQKILDERKEKLKKEEEKTKQKTKQYEQEAEKAKQALTETKPRHEVTDTEYLDSIIDGKKKELAKVTKENDRVKADNVVSKHSVDEKTKKEMNLIDQKDIATKEYNLDKELSEGMNDKYLRELNHTLEINPQEDFVVGVNKAKDSYVIIPVETREGVTLNDAKNVALEKLGIGTDIRLVNRKNIHNKVVEANKKVNEKLGKQLKEQFTNKELVYRHEANKGYKNSSQQHYDNNTEKKLKKSNERKTENRIKNNLKRIEDALKHIGITQSINATTIDDVLEQSNALRQQEYDNRVNNETEVKGKMNTRMDDLTAKTDQLKAQLDGKMPKVEKKIVEKKVQKKVKKKVPMKDYLQEQANELEKMLKQDETKQVKKLNRHLDREIKRIEKNKDLSDTEKDRLATLKRFKALDVKTTDDFQKMIDDENFYSLPKYVTGPIEASNYELNKQSLQLQQKYNEVLEHTPKASVQEQIQNINQQLDAYSEQAYDVGMKQHEMLMAELERARQHWSQKRMTAKNKERLAKIENFVNEIESTKDRYRDDTYTMFSEGGFNDEGLIDLLKELDFGKDAQAVMSQFSEEAYSIYRNRLEANQKLDELNARGQTTEDIQKEMDTVSSNKYKSASIVQGEADRLIQKMLNYNLELYQDAKKSMDNLQDFTPEQQKNIRKNLKNSELVLKRLREFKTDTAQNAYKSIKDSNLFSLDEKGYIGALMNSYDGLVSKEQKLLEKIKEANKQETKAKEEQFVEIEETIEEVIKEEVEEVVQEKGKDLTEDERAKIKEEISKNYEEFDAILKRLKEWDNDMEFLSEDFILIDEAKKFAKEHGKEDLLNMIETKEKQINKNANLIKEKSELVEVLKNENIDTLNENSIEYRKEKRTKAIKEFKDLQIKRDDKISRAQEIKDKLFNEVLYETRQKTEKLKNRKKELEDLMDNDLDTKVVIEEKIKDVKDLRKKLNKDLPKEEKISSKELTMKKGRSKSEPDLFTLETTKEIFEANKDLFLKNAELVKQEGNKYTLRAQKGLKADTLGLNKEYEAITKELESIKEPKNLKELVELVETNDDYRRFRRRTEDEYNSFKRLYKGQEADLEVLKKLRSEIEKWKPIKSKVDQANEQGQQVTKQTLEEGFVEKEGKVYEEVEVTNEEALQKEINRIIEEDYGKATKNLQDIDKKMKQVEKKRVKQEQKAKDKEATLEAKRIEKQKEIEQAKEENEIKIRELEQEIEQAIKEKEQLEAQNKDATKQNEAIDKNTKEIEQLVEDTEKKIKEEQEEYEKRKLEIEEETNKELEALEKENAGYELEMAQAEEYFDNILAENVNTKFKLAEEQKKDRRISPIVKDAIGRQRTIKRNRKRATKNINSQELAQETHTSPTNIYEATDDIPERDFGDNAEIYNQNILNNMSTKKTISEKSLKDMMGELKLDFTKYGLDPVKNAPLISSIMNYNNRQGKNAQQAKQLIDEVFSGLSDTQYFDLNRFLLLRSEFEGFHQHGQKKFSLTNNMKWKPGQQKHEFIINQLQEVQGIIEQDVELMNRVKLWDDTFNELNELLIQKTKEVRGVDRRNQFSRKNYFKNIVIDEMKAYNKNKKDYVKNGKLKGYIDIFEKHGNEGAIKTNAADLYLLTHMAQKNELTWLELLQDIQTENKKTPVLQELNKNLQGLQGEVENAVLNATDESGFNKTTTIINRLLNNTEIPTQDKDILLNYMSNPIDWKNDKGQNILQEIQRIAKDGRIAQTKKLVSLAKDGFFDASRDYHDLVRRLKDGEISFSDSELQDFAHYVYSDHHLIRGKNETKHLLEAFGVKTDLENVITDTGMKFLHDSDKSIMDFIPEGYQLTDEFGNVLSRQAIDRAAKFSSPYLSDFHNPEALTKYFLNQVMASQGQEGYIHQNLKDGQFMILPDDTVKLLGEITQKRDVKNKFLNNLNNFIKKNILMGPENVFRFNFNATMLDLWRTSITNPGVLIKHMPKAAAYIMETKAPGALTNLYEQQTGKQIKLLDDATREFYDSLINEFEAVFGGGFMAWEVGDHGNQIMAKEHKGLLDLAQTNEAEVENNPYNAFKVAKQVGKFYNTLLEWGGDATQARESIMRLAYMADATTRLDAGKDIEFGASNKKQIKALLENANQFEGETKRKKQLEAMSLLANQNYINYAETSKFSQRLKPFIPFISFQEGNLKWHWRLMNNMVSDITSRDATTTQRMRGINKAGVAFMMMSGIGQTIWNNIMREFFDAPEDEYIPDYLKNLSYEMPGLGQIDGYILGPGGKIFNKANATLDLLDYTPMMAREGEYAEHLGNKIFSMGNPMAKTALGIWHGVNYYDTTPQKRDKQFSTLQHSIQQIGALFGWNNTVTNAINVWNGVPTKYYQSKDSEQRENVGWSFLRNTADKTLRTVEQNEEVAWERLRGKQYEYLKDMGKEKQYDAVNEEYNEKQRLKDAIRKGIRHQDDDYTYNNMFALVELLRTEGKSDKQIRSEIKQSLQSLSFLGALTQSDRADFMYNYLNEKEREMLKEAVEWERKMFGPLYNFVYGL